MCYYISFGRSIVSISKKLNFMMQFIWKYIIKASILENR